MGQGSDSRSQELWLLAIIRDLMAALEKAANTTDRWADQSLNGGWLTHQVQANRELANDCRRIVANAKQRLGR